jgi:MFS family permease
VGAIACGALALIAFVIVERRVEEPILPFSLLRDPVVATSAASMALAAMCMFGTLAFVPLFAQGIIGTSATASGLVLTPLMLGAVTATIVSGQWVSRTGRYRGIAMLGPIVLGAGMALLWRMDVTTTLHEVARNMLVAGLGMGLMMQLFVVAAQNAVPLAVIGTTTALLQFGRAMGTTFGVTIFGVIVNHGLPREARGRTSLAHQLPGQAREQLAAALHPAFLLAVGAAGVVLVLVYFGLHDRPLRSGFNEEELAARRDALPEVP